jgi:hypothetical protein
MRRYHYVREGIESKHFSAKWITTTIQLTIDATHSHHVKGSVEADPRGVKAM